MSKHRIEKISQAWENLSDALRAPRNEDEYQRLVDFVQEIENEVGEDKMHPLHSLTEVGSVLIAHYIEEENRSDNY